MTTTPSRFALRLASLLGASALVSSPVLAADVSYHWSGNGTTQGGAGTWNTTDARFGTVSGGPYTTVWDNALRGSDYAVFGGTGGQVDLGAEISARRLVITGNGYTIGSGTITSDSPSNGLFVQSQQTGTATVNANFVFTQTGGASNVRARVEGNNNAATLNLGGNYSFNDTASLRRFDLESNSNTLTHTLNFSGVLSGGTNVRLRIGQSAGSATTFNLSGANTYQGNTEIVRGTVNASNASAFGTGSVTIGNGSTATTDTARVNVVGAINLSNIWATTGIAGNGAFTSVIGKGATDATTSTLSGDVFLASNTTKLAVDVGNAGGRINMSGLVQGTGAGSRSLTKNGVGTLALTRAAGNTFDGGVIVNAGTFLANNTSGSATGTGPVTVASGATVGGNALIEPNGTNTITVSGIVSAGDNGIGTFTLNGGSTSGALLTMNDGSSFSFNLGAGNTSDRVRFFNYAGASDFVRSGTVSLNFSGAQEGTYTLFQFYSNNGTTVAASAISSGLTLGTGLDGFNATLNYNTNDITLTLVSAIPEPSAFAALAGLGALGVVATRRRRR